MSPRGLLRKQSHSLRESKTAPAPTTPAQNSAPIAVPVYHLSVKPISRATGRSATAAAAYRAGAKVIDERTGEVHDYTRKGGVLHSELVLPAGAAAWAEDRSALWSAAELAEKRKDARVAREYEVAIPKELTPAQGAALVRDFAQDLVERHGVAVDFNIHRDHARTWDGSEKGFDACHAHVLTSTRRLGPNGFAEKTAPELSDTKRKSLGLDDGAAELERIRHIWEVTANRHLEQAGVVQRIDRRSLKDQGVDREPTRHLGPIVTERERRGQRTDVGDVNRRIQAAFEQGLKERRELAVLNQHLVDTQTSVTQALQLRQSRQGLAKPAIEPAMASIAPSKLAPVPPQRAQARAEPGRPNFKVMAIQDQAKAYDIVLARIAANRQERATRVAGKALARQNRREKLAKRLELRKPEPPRGLLAVWKQGAYDEARGVWERQARRVEKLVRQADALRIGTLKVVAQARDWALARLTSVEPELVKRVHEHRAIEMRERLENQWQAKQTRDLQKKPDRDIER